MKLHQPSRKGKASSDGWGLTAVGADRSPYDGSGVTVAVLDTGIDVAHRAFDGCRERIKACNFTTEAPDDIDGHGTHCAGTIFGGDVDGVRIGIARGIERALVAKVLGEGGGTSETLVNALAWAVSGGAQVISMSLGIDFPGLVRLYQDDDYPPELATSLALLGYRENVEPITNTTAFTRENYANALSRPSCQRSDRRWG